MQLLLLELDKRLPARTERYTVNNGNLLKSRRRPHVLTTAKPSLRRSSRAERRRRLCPPTALSEKISAIVLRAADRFVIYLMMRSMHTPLGEHLAVADAE